MPAEDARADLTRQWLIIANQDMRMATLAARADDELRGIGAFHAQQAAEKALKGFLAWHDAPFRRTHDLVELVEQCADLDPTFASLRGFAAFLTRFAEDSLYPGTGSAPDEQDADGALRHGREVMLFVHAQLPVDVLP